MEKLDIMTKLVNERNIDQVCTRSTVVQAGFYVPTTGYLNLFQACIGV